MDAINPAATSFGILSAFAGMIPLGAMDEQTGLTWDSPRPNVGLREQHTDFEPEFELEYDHWLLGVNHVFDFAELSLLELEDESDFVSDDDLESVEDLESDEDELSLLLSAGGLGRP